MNPDPQLSTVLLEDRRIRKEITDLSQEEMVFWDTLFFLTPVTFDTWTILLCPRKILPKNFDGAEQEFISVTVHKVFQGQDSEPIETRVSHRRILGVINEIRKEERKNVQDLQPREWRTRNERPSNSLNLLADARASKKYIFQEMCSLKVSLRGSKGGQDKHLTTRERFQFGGWTFCREKDFLKLRNTLEITVLEARSITVKEKTWLKVAWYPLTAEWTTWVHGAGRGRTLLLVEQRPSKEWYPFNDTNEGTGTTLTGKGQSWSAWVLQLRPSQPP